MYQVTDYLLLSVTIIMFLRNIRAEAALYQLIDDLLLSIKYMTLSLFLFSLRRIYSVKVFQIYLNVTPQQLITCLFFSTFRPKVTVIFVRKTSWGRIVPVNRLPTIISYYMFVRKISWGCTVPVKRLSAIIRFYICSQERSLRLHCTSQTSVCYYQVLYQGRSFEALL